MTELVHFVEAPVCVWLVEVVSFVFWRVLFRAVLLIAATAVEYTVQYFLASSTSELRITPPNSTRTAG